MKYFEIIKVESFYCHDLFWCAWLFVSGQSVCVGSEILKISTGHGFV